MTTQKNATALAGNRGIQDGAFGKHQHNNMQEAIAADGYGTLDVIHDGQIHRFTHPDDKPGSHNCWYVSHRTAGAYGSWKLGNSETWSSKKDVTFEESQKLRQQIRVAEGHRRADLEILRNDAADEARRLWDSGSEEICHPYPDAKLIQPYGARQLNNMLLVPMRFNGAIVNIQRIFPNGKKLFLKSARVIGCYHLIGEPQERIRVAEGFATACSIHERKGYTVAAAFTCNNLKSVSLALKERYGSDIVVCADNDTRTPGNPGLSAAKEAAALVGGTYIYPMFDSGQEGTDFNDYLNGGGAL